MHYDFTQFGLDTAQAPASHLRTSLIFDPADGKLPPLTAAGQARAAARAEQAKRVGRWDSAQSNELDDRCMIFAGAGPPMLPQSYNSNYQIVQTSGYVMILFEMAHDLCASFRSMDAARAGDCPAMDRDSRPLGWRHRHRDDEELQRKKSAEGVERAHEGDGTLDACGRRHDPLSIHHRR